MRELILIKYGDLVLKKDNRKFFIKALKDNIIQKLNGISFEIKEDLTRMFIYSPDINECVRILKKIYGIYEIVIAYEIEGSDIEDIKRCVLNSLNGVSNKTFKVFTKRSDKAYPINSMEFSRIIGAHILKNVKGMSVDVHNPDISVVIEIRQSYTYIYGKVIPGLKGYPVGTLGKALLMLSGGIDSPVAGYLAIKKGIKLDYIYFESLPHTSLEARNKVIKLAKVLEEYNNGGKVYIVNFTKIQEMIYKNLKPDYLITIMRRMMYKISEIIAKKNKHLAIINGESIGQVASQTLTSIKAINNVTNYPIIRPLASFDKLEIIEISKNIGTYEISIEPYQDCCTVFVPKHPVINPDLNVIYEEELKFNFEDLINEAVKEVKIIKLNELETSNFNEYL